MKRRDLINPMLPDDILTEIFCRLDESKLSCDACSLVCRRWYRLDRACRRTLRIGASGDNQRIVVIELLASRFTAIQNLFVDERLSTSILPFHSYTPPRKRHRRLSTEVRVANRNLLSDESEYMQLSFSDCGLRILVNSWKGLEKLCLIWCNQLTSLGWKYVAENCKNLRCLDLQGCFIGDEALIKIGECCKQLENLNLCFCESLTNHGLSGFFQERKASLKGLGITACTQISDASLNAAATNCTCLESLSLDSEFISNEGIISIAKGCRSLKILKLKCTKTTDEALLAVGSLCSSLELLALCRFGRFTDRSLFAIGKGCKNLKDLTINDCSFLSDKSLETVAIGCPRLKHLEINGCLNIGTLGLEAIGRSCRGLLELSLLFCQRIGSAAFSAVGRGCCFLQVLHLVDCSSIDDDAICSIAQGCSSLKKLHIRRCYEVGDRGIIAIGSKCKFLEDLSLTFCDRVGDKALIAIGRGCSLHQLTVSGCVRVTSVGLTAIAHGCPELAHLEASVLENLGDAALVELGACCSLLKYIVISHCSKITDTGLAHIAKGCKRLEICHMVHCPGLTGAGVATVISSCPNIKKVLVEDSKVSERTKRRASLILAFPNVPIF